MVLDGSVDAMFHELNVDRASRTSGTPTAVERLRSENWRSTLREMSFSATTSASSRDVKNYGESIIIRIINIMLSIM